VLDVRKRLERGESAVPGERSASGTDDQADGGERPAPPARLSTAGSRSAAFTDPSSTVEKLVRDPSLCGSERGKAMLRLLHVNAVAGQQLPDVAAGVPPHCVAIVMQLANQYAQMWQDFARELDGRARIIDPAAAIRSRPRTPPTTISLSS
jgi:hypothetical protein